MTCHCEQSGWCEARQRTMSKRQFAACRQGAFDGSATGLGDVVEKVTRATGIQRVAKAVAKATGRPCGCAKRQDALNDLMPFRTDESATPESPAPDPN